jgi:glycosyltransferase involved in cell wall biosynthesis
VSSVVRAGEEPGAARLRVGMAIRAFIPHAGTGVQRQLARLLPLLAERGVDATVLSGRTGRTKRRERIHEVEVRRSALRGYSPLASANFVAASFSYLARNRRSFDLLHAHGAIHPGTVAVAAQRLGIPTLVRVTRTGSRGDFIGLCERRWGHLQARHLIERSWFVALSSLVRDELLERGVPGEKIFLIPNGVDPLVFRPPSGSQKEDLRERLRLGSGTIVISTSRLVAVKRLDIVIDALRALPDARLVILGGGEERARLEDQARRSGLGDRVRFMGATRAVEDYLRAADIFVLPSESEGMSNSLLEAMACGLACVTSEVAGVPELFEGRCGVVVEAGDRRAWAESISELVADRRRRAEMGERAAGRVASRFTFQATAEKTIQAYRHVIAAERGAGA